MKVSNRMQQQVDSTSTDKLRRMPMLFSQENAPHGLTRAEIHLDRLVHNIRAVRRQIGPSVEFMAIVKADAYGHGAVMIAKTAIQNGVDRLAVYTLAEAIALRRAGIEAPIVALGPFDVTEAGACVAFSIRPTLTSLSVATALSHSAMQASKTVPYYIEVDTGLTRYGLPIDEVLPFVQALSALPGLQPEGLFTHFARADERAKEPTWQQFRLFERVRQQLADHGFRFPLCHVANSAATIDLPGMYLDMVRIGIALYGYYPSADVSRTVPLSPIMAIGSRLARVRRVPTGTTVSYGVDFRTERPSVIGLVPFGYADGMPRNVQGKGFVLVRGQRAPIVGRIAMDQFMVDLTDLTDVQEGDEVVILGRSGDEEISADDLAAWAGTISYEVLTRISPRVPRLYIENGRVVAMRRAMSGLTEPELLEL
jgi:alanine racemase